MSFRQTLLCANGVNVNGGAPATNLIMAASEKGRPAFAPMVIAAGVTNDPRLATRDVSDRLIISSMLLKNRIQFLKGRGVGGAPPQAQNLWCPRRAIARWTGIDSNGPINTGDTFDVELALDPTGLLGGVNSFATAAVAFLPSNPSMQAKKPAGPFIPVGAEQAVAIAAGVGGQVVVTFDEDGVADLSNASLGGAGAQGANCLGFDPLEQIEVGALTLPDRDQLISGQGAPGAPGLIWSEDRAFNYFEPGLVEVSAGSQIIWQVFNFGATNIELDASIPFAYYPGGRKAC